MFEVNAAFTFLKPDGTEAKPPYVRSWVDVEKVEVVEQLERSLMKAMLKMNDFSGETVTGNMPKLSDLNPCEMRLTAEVLEDGVKWTKVTFEWPNMGEGAQSLMMGIVNGELSTIDRGVKGKEKKRQGKKDR